MDIEEVAKVLESLYVRESPDHQNYILKLYMALSILYLYIFSKKHIFTFLDFSLKMKSSQKPHFLRSPRDGMHMFRCGIQFRV